MVLSTELTTLPALFVSHGMPTLAVSKNSTTNTLAKIAQNLPRPKAIIIMSAHWLTQGIAVSSASRLSAWHDYQLPSDNKAKNVSSYFTHEKLKHTQYSPSGNPALADRIIQLLQTNGFDAHADSLRPLDHGVWTPLIHMYPQADVPVVQLSLPHNFDAYACYQLGACLAMLRHEQIMLIGSGSITHNLAALKDNEPVYADSKDEHTEPKALGFKQWMLHALTHDIPKALDWQHAPFAKENHPTAEHLMPLFFALGAGQLVSLVHASTSMQTLGMDIYRFD